MIAIVDSERLKMKDVQYFNFRVLRINLLFLLFDNVKISSIRFDSISLTMAENAKFSSNQNPEIFLSSHYLNSR